MEIPSDTAAGNDHDVRTALAAELAKPSPDYQRIAVLSNQLLDAVPGQTRFSVDAGLVARLGRELVSKHDTALAELVKNAYDADATTVEVHIARSGFGNFIEIRDNGSGMSREALVQGFMRLATGAKVEQPTSPRFGRRRAGRKGVGRFAAERLGRRLVLTTADEAALHSLCLDIEWQRFSTGTNLSNVLIPVAEIPKEFTGTQLRIENLRDAWPPSVAEKAFRYIINLVDPGDLTQSTGTGSDFDVRFFLDGQRTNVVDARSQIRQYAYADIALAIDDTGAVTWSLKCNRLQINIVDRPLRLGSDERTHAVHARNVRLKAHYFIIDRNNIPTVVFPTVQSYLSLHGGIRLYRNGFRVPPYGEIGDDWLGLDQLSSRRTQTLAPIRNRNFLGSVSIDDRRGLFEETSSREGLIESSALTELVTLASSALVTAVREIDAARERLKLKRPVSPVNPASISVPPAPQPRPSPQSETAGADAARNLTFALNAARGALVGTEVPPDAATRIAALTQVAATAADLARERDALVKEIDLLRVLASMGLAVGQFTHEFSTLSGAMRADLAVLLEADRSPEEKRVAASALRVLLDQARSFSGLFKSMTEQNALRDREPIDLYEATTSFMAGVQSVLTRNGVTIHVDDDGDQVFSPPMHRSEFFAIMLNFTTNSIKAAKRAGREGRILVQIGKQEDGSATLSFLDNGNGIAPEVRDTLFDAFVTTTAANPTAETDEDLALGSGLGLTIVRDIVSAMGGTVSVAEASDPYVTCMRIDFPPAEEEA